MAYVLFVVSAVAGAAGYALLRWTRPRAALPAPVAEEPPPEPFRVDEHPPLPKPLRIVLVVEPTEEPEGITITLPSVGTGEGGTYVVESVEVEPHDFFDGFATRSRQAAHDLRYCDLVVRGGQVITRAAMPLGVLMTNNPDLVDTCARALVDPTRRPAFQEQVAEVVRKGDVLRWLERHEQALAQPLPEMRVDTANLQVPKPPWNPEDRNRWPFVFEPRQADKPS